MSARKFSYRYPALLALGAVLGISLFQFGNDGLEKDWGVKLELGFNKMPETGEIDSENQLWIGHRWPKSQGGIASRWLVEARGGTPSLPYTESLPTYETLKRLSPKDRRAYVKNLSPTEKFDLFRGRLDFPLTLEERRRNVREAQAELPLLHGWALASTATAESALLRPFADFSFFRRSLAGVAMREPGEVTGYVRLLPGLDLEIPFAASDVKALISFYVGVRMKDHNSALHQIGSELRPMKARDFHTLLTNTVGLQGHPLTAQFVVGSEVQPKVITRFESDIRIEEPNVYRITTHLYAPKLASPHWKAMEPGMAEEERIDTSYRVRVSGDQKIISSEWLDGSRPIALARTAPVPLNAEFEKLGELYQPASQ